MPEEKISIVVPVRKMAGKLEKLEKWLAQIAETEIQVVLVHDFADLDTQLELQEIVARNHSRDIELHKIKAGSPGIARNEGLKHCKHEWVVFADSDDILNISEVNRLRKVLNSEGPYDVVVCGYSIENSTRKTSRKIHSSSKWDVAYSPAVWRMVIKKSILGVNPFSKYRMGEDQLFLLSIKFFEREIMFLKSEIYRYFQDVPGQLTSLRSSFEDLEFVIVEVKLFAKHGFKVRNKFAYLILLRLILSQLRNLSSRGDIKLLIAALLKSCGFLASNPLAFFGSLLILTCKKLKFALSQRITYIYITGGLGNQLFQLAAGIHRNPSQINLESTLGKPRVTNDGRMAIDDLELPNQVQILPSKKSHPFYSKVVNLLLRQSVNRTFATKIRRVKFIFSIAARFILLLYYKKLIRPIAASDNGYCELKIPKKGNEFLIGYFQTYEWLNDPYTKREMQGIKLKESNAELNLFLSRNQNQKAILVHVRLGDYRSHEHFGTLPTSYFATSLGLLKEQLNFDNYAIWLFSDEPDSAIELVPNEWRKKVITVPDFGGEACVTLEAMRHADAFIISNSTLSWWAAQLRFNESAPVIAPDPWFRSAPEPSNLIQKDWIRVKSW